MASVFWRQLARTVRQTLGRFVALVVIVAMGCGFFAGLRMTGVGMRRSADAYFDRTRLFDLELVSTLGLSDAAVKKVASVPGVDAVMASRSVDVMAAMGGVTRACRVTSLGTAAPGEGPAADGLNRPELVEGRWPESADECVLVYKEAEKDAVPDRVRVLYGAQDLDGVLAVRDFAVVGLVRAPAYVFESTLSTTSLGSGMLGQAAFVLPDAFDADAPYTEVYLSVEGAAGELWGTDAYQARIDGVADELGARLGPLAEARTAEVRDEAQEALDAERARFERERADAEGRLADSRSELDAAAAKLEDGAKELAAGRSELASRAAELEEGRRQTAAGAAELEAQGARLAEGRAQAEEGAAELDAAAAQIEEGDRALGAAAAELDARTAELEDAAAELEGQRAAVEQGREAVRAYDSAVSALAAQASAAGVAGATPEQIASSAAARLEELRQAQEAGTPGLDEAVEAVGRIEEGARALASQTASVEAARAAVASFDEAEAGLAEGRRELKDAASQLSEKRGELARGAAAVDAGRRRMDATFAQLAEGDAQLAAGRRGLEEGEAELARGQARLDEAQGELDAAAAELSSGEARLAEGEASWREGREEADARLADAQRALDEAQDEVDAIEPAEVFVIDRTRNYGAESYLSDSERIDAIATAFPFFFFLVAALVSLTTMTRMVEDDRGLVGTYKALGYGRGAICARYLVYSGSASLVGAALGIAAMSQLLPWVIFTAYDIVYAVPARPMPLPVEWAPALAACALGVAVTVGSALAACLSTLRESPAALMQPKAPKAGRRILLERVGPLWRRLSFSWKVTLRNIFRYKRRFFMTVVGIAGCCALLVTGFGVRDAVNDIIDKQFLDIMHYNAQVGLASDASDGERAAVVDCLASLGGPAPVEVFEENLVAKDAADGERNLACTAVVPQDPAALSSVVTLRERVGGVPVDFGPDSVVVTEKFAATLGLAPGDTLRLWRQDEAGNPTGEPVGVRVTAVCENYLGSFVYLGPEAYGRAFGPLPAPNTVLATLPGDEAARSEADERVQAMAGVETLMLNDESIDNYRSMLSSVDLVMVVLIAAAALLAFVVLYNLASINIAERSREIASLKVLGFLPREVCTYVFREIAIIVFVGALVGLVLGTWFEGYVVVTAEMDAAMFGREIHWPSYFYSFGLTLGFCVLVLAAMVPKLSSIDMVESLKSVE